MDRDTIIALTLAVRVYRRLRELGIYDMPIDTSGLKNKAMKLRAKINRISEAYDGADVTAGRHLADLDTLDSDIGDMQTDLEAAVRIMGNGGGSGEPKEPAKPAPAAQPHEPQVTASSAPVSAPEVAQSATFRPGEFQPISELPPLRRNQI